MTKETNYNSLLNLIPYKNKKFELADAQMRFTSVYQGLVEIVPESYRGWTHKCAPIDLEYGEWVATPAHVIQDKARHPQFFIQKVKRKDSKERAYLGLYRSKKNSAKHNKDEWSLTLEEFIQLVSSTCSYCGVAPHRFFNPHKNADGSLKKMYTRKVSTPDHSYIDSCDIFYNGIDRMQSGLGYHFYNCSTACWDCNRAKGELSMQEWKEWVVRISNFRCGEK